jgi:hypothetical protein
VSVPLEDRFVLSPDGKTLTTMRRVTAPDGVTAIKIVMTKR